VLRPFGLIVCAWALWYAYWLVAAMGTRKKTVQREPWSSLLAQRGLLLGGYALIFERAGGFFGVRFLPVGDAWPWLGLILTLLGHAFSIWARRTLGSNWSGIVTLKEGHELVQSGPYSLARHPIYTGLLTASLGTALALGTLGALLGLGMLAAAFALKMNVEESFMRREFGDAYGDYSKKVKRVIPLVF
jgi:protein-S-isoprenylcysteine O-methyltransferase Ste14